MSGVQERIDALEAELARLRALLEAQAGGAKTPPPPPPSPPREAPLVPLEALAGYRVSPRMVAQAAGLLGVWPRDFGGSLAFTPEEAEQISALLAAYTRHLRWDKALEDLGVAPPPPAVSLARLLLLGEAAREHARALARAVAGSDLPPVVRESAVKALEGL
ncbi:hypothetical protein TthHB5008_08860 [Thermus thermophilus]|uniref:hypothetical protein n=1 Tax=Thermus thermophilus TaxID=274 RepID=UPI00194E854A|nr:hypothetical protein [Thermus thermophilus]BCP97785.1 hypothetical protein TthHB5002_08880 [Thermus thermophilus]BCQ00116.1 hypothetical protein TthHB5008_08860 [Thermus thermophilus]